MSVLPHLLIALMLTIVSAVPALAESYGGRVVNLNRAETGQTVTGSARLNVEDGRLMMQLDLNGLTPGMHLAHLHGFTTQDPDEANCATALADTNTDNFVDLIETRPISGETMVPFSADPVSLEIQTDTYPGAGASGELRYERTIDLSALEDALREKHGTPPALVHRVIYVHGVPGDMALPGTVRSLDGVPAHVTLPIACIELHHVMP